MPGVPSMGPGIVGTKMLRHDPRPPPQMAANTPLHSGDMSHVFVAFGVQPVGLAVSDVRGRQLIAGSKLTLYVPLCGNVAAIA